MANKIFNVPNHLNSYTITMIIIYLFYNLACHYGWEHRNASKYNCYLFSHDKGHYSYAKRQCGNFKSLNVSGGSKLVWMEDNNEKVSYSSIL